MSREALDFHFSNFLSKIIADAGPLAGKTLIGTESDSWEAGPQNWTGKIKEEFLARRGYDLTKYYPVLSGMIMDSVEVSERFLWDFRRTVADLFADNYFGRLATLCHENGMQLWAEIYCGNPPIENTQCWGRTDVVMCEFWLDNQYVSEYRNSLCKWASASAHVYGKKIVAAESFTVGPNGSAWKVDPFALKKLGDWAFCRGVNRFVFHNYAHNPWTDLKPGMSMGHWGINCDRGNTWWEPGAAYMKYLARCQYLLQQGLFVGDVFYYYGEGAPNELLPRELLTPTLPDSYDYDGGGSEVLLTRMSVKNGRIVLPDGMSYRVLVMPPAPPSESLSGYFSLNVSKSHWHFDNVKITTGEAVEVSDDFSAGSGNLTTNKGKWAIENGEYSQSAMSVSDSSASINGKKWGNATYEVDVKCVDKNGDAKNWAGIQIGKIQAAGDVSSHGYLVNCRANGEVELIKAAKGLNMLGKASTGLDFSVSRHLKVVKSDTGIKVYINHASTPCIEVAAVRQPAFMTVEVAQKLRALVRSGATVVVNARPSMVPGLSGYPACDSKLKAIIDDLYGNCDGVSVKEHGYGAGRIIWGKPLAEVLAGLDCKPDFEYWSAGPVETIGHIHRNVNGQDVYFISNQSDRTVNLMCAFRVSGKAPELWRADSGAIQKTALFREVEGRTIMPVTLDRYGSVFVVFKAAAPAAPFVSLKRNGAMLMSIGQSVSNGVLADLSNSVVWDTAGNPFMECPEAGTYELGKADGGIVTQVVGALPSSQTISGAWKLFFPPNLGAPDCISLDTLISWPKHTNPGVKYFSGTATYKKAITIPPEWISANQAVSLDLGKVMNLAEVRLNGKSLGVLWKPPFKIDMTGEVHAGTNDLEVLITNLWPNRLIGDEWLADDCEWKTQKVDGGNFPFLTEWPAWLRNGTPRPSPRVTFTAIKYYTKDSPLLESGLIGPVTVKVSSCSPLSANF